MNTRLSLNLAVLMSSIILFISPYPLQAQNYAIELGKEKIGLNEQFTITLKVTNEQIRQYSGFPEINGLQKTYPSESSRMSIVNGRMASSQSITMNYQPTRKGTFRIPPFEISVNGQTLSHPGTSVTVTDPVRRQSNVFDPFGMFDSRRQRDNSQQPEFIDVKDDAFFAITTNKEEAYIGEGIGLTAAFYVQLKDVNYLAFPQGISQQIADLVKKIRPKNCLEQRLNIERLEPHYVEINGKKYQQYKLYQAVLFPLNTEEIKIPSAKFRMIKKQASKQRDIFGYPAYTKNEEKDYYSQPKNIRIKELPPHPLKDKVAVGAYELEESLSEERLATGGAVSYKFIIKGQGNVPTISAPEPKIDERLSFYPPSIDQETKLSGLSLFGIKEFEYFIEVNEPGEHALSDFVEWIYFDINKDRYDTLRPERRILATGESKQSMVIDANAHHGLYDKISTFDNRLTSLYFDRLWGYAFNITAVVLLLLTLGWSLRAYLLR